MAKIYFNPIFYPVNTCVKRYRALKGSAGSGKSVNVAQDYIVKLMDKRYKGANLLVVRKFEQSHKDSTFAELQGAINRVCGKDAEKVWEVKQSPMRLTCKTTGNEIVFRGMADVRQREKLKSITFKQGKLTWVWCEEATELERSDVDIIDDRLRGALINPYLYYQITLTFNPIADTHWIKKDFFDRLDDNVLTHHSTYLDNLFIDPAYAERMERRRLIDPDGYKIYGLGQWGTLGGLILNNWTVKDFPRAFSLFHRMTMGQDFGFNHANAILEVGFKEREIYICREIYVHEKITSEIINIANRRHFEKRMPMWCDSAEPDRIKEWAKAGYRARAVSKDPGSVNAQIDWLKKNKIFVHPECVNTIKELQAWKWAKDKKTGEYIDEPVEVFDDAMAALRYSIESERRNVKLFSGQEAL